MSIKCASYVEYYGKQSRSHCGYCRSSVGSMTHSMWCHSLQAHEYQALINRGWRRSGKYLYKPIMPETCCPAYTIRCALDEWQISKSQKKCIKHFFRSLHEGFELDDGATHKSPTGDEETASADADCCPEAQLAKLGAVKTRRFQEARDIQTIDAKADPITLEIGDSGASQAKPNDDKPEISQPQENSAVANAQQPKQKKAKLLRLERRQAKRAAAGLEPLVVAPKQQPPAKDVDLVGQCMRNAPANAKHRYEVRLLSAEESLSTTPTLFSVYQKYQQIVHGDQPNSNNLKSFTRFLVSSPMQLEHGPSAPACGFGTFHQQYWIDGQLIAVSVLDILPECVSSVYLFYDPAYRALSLGTYSIIEELRLLRRLQTECPSIAHYYMGYYIESCAKMRYKANVRPSALLCPESYTWHRITEELVSKIAHEKYQRLNDDLDALDENAFVMKRDAGQMQLLVERTLFTYSMFKKQRRFKIAPDLDSNMAQFGELIGRKLSHQLIWVA